MLLRRPQPLRRPKPPGPPGVGHVAERVGQDLARCRVVVHDQHWRLGNCSGKILPLPGGRAQTEPGGEQERAADAGLALDPDPAAHQLDEPLADRQAQPGAAVLAGGGHVGLGERLKQLRRLFRRHADAGVAHRELELHLLADLFEQLDLQADLAVLGELDGVVDQVGEDLAEPQRVAAQILRDR